MRLCWHTLYLLVAILFSSNSFAQTLNEKLIVENPTDLAEQARVYGNIVRGAILFHQGNINCAKCHRATPETNPIGPDLSRIAPEVTDEYLVESILQTSKQITKGFETIVVLTLDGQLINGRIFSEDDQKIVIRDIQNVDRLIAIERNDIDEIQPGKKSYMPENLANELKDRQQFLDLLRYVIDIKERGPNANVAAAQTAVRRELSPELNGLVLLQEFNCVACHASTAPLPNVHAKMAPRLNWSAKWLNPEFIEAFIANPHAVKPGTTMPAMLAGADEATRQEFATAITHFLVSKIGNEFQSQPIDTEAVPRGFELFQSVGCVACHAPRNGTAVEQPLKESIALGDLAPKYSVKALIQFLENPLAVRASGHMPNMQLTWREASDIANFLLQSTKKSTTKWKSDAELAKRGETFFAKQNCANCHTDQADEKHKPVAQLAFDKLDPAKGCLSGDRGDWPMFDLGESELDSIRAALQQPPIELTPNQQIEVSLVTFNCIACHNRDDLGGVTADRNPHFQTINLNLGDQGRIPPTLTGVGAKLKPEWMRDVLVNHRSIRPYMNTRMPQYGEENIGHLVQLFQANDKLTETKFAEFTDQKETRLKGLELAGNNGLNCVACHTYQYKPADTMPAVDVTEMADRLKKDWFYQYMLNPQKFSPNTVMPSFWPGGQAINKEIEGTAEDQLEALWQYLLDGRQARMPSGVVREPLEIVVTNEAEMLRRSYPGIGKRGIGVGYPGGINLTFDAEQLRLDTIWKGKFVDPSGVWTGQGSGNVTALGKTIEFAKGPELDDRDSPWIVDDGRPSHHQFKGYFLDQSRRPTFQYVFDSVAVEDFFSEVIDQEPAHNHLRRSISLSSSEQRDKLRFRIASAADISAGSDGQFSVGKGLKIRVASEHVAQIVDADGNKRLEVELELTPKQTQKLVIEYFWE